MTRERPDLSGGEKLENILPSDALSRFLMLIARIIGVAVAGAMASAEGDIQLIRQQSLKNRSTSILDVSTLLEAWRRELVTPGDLTETLHRHGFGNDVVPIFVQLAETLMGPAELMDLELRGVIDGAERTERLALLGYSTSAAEEFRTLATFKPPVQDVLTFAVREVFRPAVRERFEMDAEFPGDDPETGAELMALFAQVGIDETTARQYWAAHWTLPSLNQAFEMLHRTSETGVTEADLDSLMVAADVMRRWREPLKAIAYNPITRVDVRRWHAVGLLTEEELTERYRRVGFSPEDAELMTEFTVRFNEQSEDDALAPFRSTLRTRATGLWRRGAMSTAALRQVFEELGFPSDQAEAYVTAAEFEREADRVQDVLRRVEPLYVRGFWTEEEAIDRLRGLDFGEDELRVVLDDWTLARELREETELDRSERDLSKSDVLGAFRDDLIPRVDAEAFLLALGYDDAETQVLAEREELRKGTEARGRAEKGARALFLAGRADRDATMSALATAEIPPARITLLLLEWESERAARTPELTTAQVQKSLKLGIIEEQEAARRLDAKGYTEADRDILIELAGSAEGVTEEGV